MLSAYSTREPGTASNFGSPSYVTLTCASRRRTAAVRGVVASLRASRACSVPGTNARTSAFSESGRMRRKGAGRSSGAT